MNASSLKSSMTCVNVDLRAELSLGVEPEKKMMCLHQSNSANNIYWTSAMTRLQWCIVAYYIDSINGIEKRKWLYTKQPVLD